MQQEYRSKCVIIFICTPRARVPHLRKVNERRPDHRSTVARGRVRIPARALHRKDKQMLTLQNARKIVDKALARASELNVSISVAVCDAGGRLIALNRMEDSIDWECDRSSMAKAVAAAITGVPSERLFEQLNTDRRQLSSCHTIVPPRGQPGGLPIIEAGIVQGGCGVSGAPQSEQDVECARVGIAAPSVAVGEPALATYANRPSAALSSASSA
jgi:glc operon protein GlcG